MSELSGVNSYDMCNSLLEENKLITLSPLGLFILLYPKGVLQFPRHPWQNTELLQNSWTFQHQNCEDALGHENKQNEILNTENTITLFTPIVKRWEETHLMMPQWHSHVVGHDSGVCWGAGWHGDGDRRLAHLQSYGILDWISTKPPCRPLAALAPLSPPSSSPLSARGPVLTDCLTPLKCRGNPIWAGSAKLLHSQPAHHDLISQLHAADCNWMNSLAGC